MHLALHLNPHTFHSILISNGLSGRATVKKPFLTKTATMLVMLSKVLVSDFDPTI